MMRSALPFWGEVYGHDMREMNTMSKEERAKVVLSNSHPLSHWTSLMLVLNWVDTGKEVSEHREGRFKFYRKCS